MTRRYLLLVIAIFALAFLAPAWPWLSGAVTIPYDAKSTFLPPVEFMARAFATDESPLWTPNVFAGWPNIADPQSMLSSPLHVLLAFASAAPGFRANDAVTFAYLFIGGVGIILYFRDRGWHAAGALVAALAFAFGGAASARLQHTGQVISLAWLPVALFLLSRALDRASWRWGALAGVAAALIVLGRDQVALLEVYVLAGFVLAHWCGEGWRIRVQEALRPSSPAALRASSSSRCRSCSPNCLPQTRTGRRSVCSMPDAARCIRRTCSRWCSPICSARWTRKSRSGVRAALPGTNASAWRTCSSRRT